MTDGNATVARHRLARRAAGRPYSLKFAIAVGDNDGTLTVPGVEYRDELVTVLEFANTAEASFPLVADHLANASVTGNGTVTITGGSTLAPGHGILVGYHDWDS